MKSFPYTTEIKKINELYIFNGDKPRFFDISQEKYGNVEDVIVRHTLKDAIDFFTNFAVFVKKADNVYDRVFVIKLFPRTRECKIIRWKPYKFPETVLGQISQSDFGYTDYD
jgi:hypothetical protein